MSGPHTPTPFKRKQNILFFTLFLYFWFFYIDTGDEHLSPDELESYKDEISDWVRENEEQMRAVQTERRDNVLNTCRKYGLDRKAVDFNAASDLGLVAEEWAYLKHINWLYIYWSKQHSLTWCKVPKAGSSTWTFNFLKLAGVNPKTHLHKVLRDHYPKQSSNKIMQDTYRSVRGKFYALIST